MSKGKVKRKRQMKPFLILGGVLLGIIAVFILLMTTIFVIKQSDIEGCVNSNANEVNEALYQNDYCRNSLYLYFHNKNNPLEGVPFVSSVEVKLVNPWHVKIQVKEDDLAAYVYDEANNLYVYTDKEMRIVERSSKKVEDLVEIKGVDLQADASGDASGDALPTQPSTARAYLSSIYSYIQQYDLSVSSLTVESSGAITMESGNVTVKLGLNVNTGEKFKRLNAILPMLSSESGTIDLTSWSSAGDDIVFTPNTSTSGDRESSEEATTESTEGTAENTEGVTEGSAE